MPDDIRRIHGSITSRDTHNNEFRDAFAGAMLRIAESIGGADKFRGNLKSLCAEQGGPRDLAFLRGVTRSR